MKRLTILFALFCLGGAFLFAQSSVTVYGIKGASGIGMVRLFETPPRFPGMEVRIEALASADLLAAKFISGEAKVGILPPNVAAKIASSGKPVQVAAVVGTGMLSLLSADPSIKSIEDLRGKTVEAAGHGATPDYVFRRILISHGLDPEKDIRLSYSLAPPEIAQSLIAGRVQLALLPEPFASMARTGKPALTEAADIQAEWVRSGGESNYPMTVLVVDRNFASQNPGFIRALLNAYKSSIEWVKANPAEAGRLVEKHGLGLRAPVAAASVPRSSYVFIPAAEARPALESLFKTFLEFSPVSIGGSLPSDSFYYNPVSSQN